MCIADIAGYQVKVDLVNKDEIRLKHLNNGNRDLKSKSRKQIKTSDNSLQVIKLEISQFWTRLKRFFLARALKSSQPLVHGLFWMIVLGGISPILGIGLPVLTLYSIMIWAIDQLFFNGFRGKINVHEGLDELSGTDVKVEHELAVFVSGCDRGFGQSYAYSLAERGFIVFAGCLSEEGIRQYENYPSIIALKLDVTSDEDTNNMAQAVKNWLNDPTATKRRFLHAIINNAGIGSNGPIDWTAVSDFEHVMEVNYFGMLRSVKAFLPILKAQVTGDGNEVRCRKYKDARIITMGSFAGHVALPGSPSYVVSKHAVIDFSTCLRAELKSFDIPVVTINPSVHGTTMMDVSKKHFEAKWYNLSEKVRREYGEESFKKWKDMLANVVCCTWDASNVVNEVIKCMESRHPLPEVFVGPDAKYVLIFLKMLPPWVVGRILSAINPCCKDGQFVNQRPQK